MDTMTVAAAAGGRAAELRTKINGLYRRKGEVELALQREHVAQEGAAAKRASLVQELPGGDDAMVGFVHAEIDGLDNTLRVSCRVAEGLSTSLSRIGGEIAALEVEFTEATRIVEQQNRERGLATLRIKLQQDRDAAENAFGNLREALATLNSTASRGVEQYGVAGQNLVTPVIEAFRHTQHNPELLGFRQSSANYNLQFMVRPMTKVKP